ncbi:MAG: DUF6055 domain-containing protein [Chloroflexota bacterium]
MMRTTTWRYLGRLPLRLLAAAILLGVLSISHGSAISSASAVTSVQGDVNCSGAADAVDSLQILQTTAGITATAGCASGAGDVDCDGDTDATDAVRILRFAGSLGNDDIPDCAAVGASLTPPTSESLIAAALQAGDITYEQSLLYRAQALFASPDLPPEYSSDVIDWEAGNELFEEIDQNEGTLSPTVLADLAPYRVRPSDPTSVFSTAASTQDVGTAGVAWQSSLIPGTNARVWALGAPGAEQPFVDPISTVWTAMLGLFVYPNSDQPGDPSVEVNPDGAIDFYFVSPGIDPRDAYCQAHPNDTVHCLANSDFGMARRATPNVGNTSSGYLIVNAGKLADYNNMLDTIAHELTHVSQYSYDAHESSWLYESTATWTAYRVMQILHKTPTYAYNQARGLYQGLDKTLNRETPDDNDKYGSWLFFLHASMERGDQIVSQVWDKARATGKNGINAVDQVFPLNDNFDDFTVRNWNKDPVVRQYKDAPDSTFPQNLHPRINRDYYFLTANDETLSLPVKPLASVYYHYTFGAAVRHIIIENNLQPIAGAHVWAIQKIDGQWTEPEDWSNSIVKTFCRDQKSDGPEPYPQDLQEVVLIISNSNITGDLPTPVHNAPRVIGDDFGCNVVTGYVETTLHYVNGDTDVMYNSGHVNVTFLARAVQDQPGDVYYDLAAGSGPVHWVGHGTYGDCVGDGETTVGFPGVPYTGAENAAGLLVVVGPGDFHSLIANAYDPSAIMVVTCPGDPSHIEHQGFDAGLFLYALMTPNTEDGPDISFEGDHTEVLGSLTYHFVWHLEPTGGTPAP